MERLPCSFHFWSCLQVVLAEVGKDESNISPDFSQQKYILSTCKGLKKKKAVLPVFSIVFCYKPGYTFNLVAKLVLLQIKGHPLLSAEGKRKQWQSSCWRVKVWTLRSKPKRNLPEWGLQHWAPWEMHTDECSLLRLAVEQDQGSCYSFNLTYGGCTLRVFFPPKSICDFDHLSLFWLCFQNYCTPLNAIDFRLICPY